ncbi:MAG: 4-(cytidine 5'-diphospho)-2-C-methyl-D-erythritol kinase [Bacteroidales bacterium]|nr:4-(cytidine 5'-diphospho)-2-C-methyl-D-erythritol kinase [Bacteroidales bacterium]MCM1148209.1 4-(cytidine 5'-diphospho)-2-C-methyl-D-erythritol kinase [Bacteroidales bacterium]MCM1207064.1 4-(cytidine 5'-diphospho)-2-C-methyl-D-erythritol kinase [Bacillota bacterium]MCM1510808.1 4-(cytidine 5'-diphospho)-2-C-methyl-D-erythritol kinase [Clostridium sp.]
MITFPCCKINLGLNVVARRADGYHDLETVFYPIPLHDALEITLMDDRFPSDVPCDLLTKMRRDNISGQSKNPASLCPEQENLVVKAYNIIARDRELPRIHAHLYKSIPSQAGLGGGSSDAASMITLLNDQFCLGLSTGEMESYASELGADCAFFITSRPAYATGIGDRLFPIDTTEDILSGYHLVLVKPDIAVSTGKAYGMIIPRCPEICCKDIIKLPISEWRGLLTNDFEEPVFCMHPELGDIKRSLYDLGAEFALMSGSGSTLFGLFKDKPEAVKETFADCFTAQIKL